jgi:peptidyl-prolyl cis-trans isomerase D
LGFFGRGQMVSSFEEAAFSTPVGQVADLVESQFGIHIIQVTDARAAGLAPLEEVRNDIRRELSLRNAEDRIFNQAEQLRAGADSLENFSSAAETAGLPLEEFRATADDRLFDLAPSPEFREAIFDLPVGGVSQPVRMAKGMAILAVVKESPPGVAPLAEVRETVGTAILNDRLRKASIVAARKAVGDNQDLDKAAKSLGIEIQDSGDLIPGPVILAGTGGNTPELQTTMFGDEIATGSKGILEVPAGALIYEVTDRTPFDSVAFQAGKADLKAELLLQKRNVYLQTVLTKIMEGYEIQINQELIARQDS